MNSEILKSLDDIEKEKGVKILFACESGSRAWGFTSTDSDFDVRFIYMHEPDYYLSVFDDRRDVIELPINDLLDVSGWDLKKALALTFKNNLALFEWINSPVVYLNKDSKGLLQKLVELYFRHDRAHYHYFSMAKGFYSKYLEDTPNPNMKKFFYCMRTISACLWIKKFNSMPPVNFEDMLTKDILPKNVVNEIRELIIEKSFKTEADTTKQASRSLDFIKSTLSMLEDFKPGKSHHEKDFIDETFRKLLNLHSDL